MKFMAIGDTHFRMNAPRYRIDKSFFDTQFKKIEWCLNKAKEMECKAIIIPGDFCDSPHLSDYCKARLISLLRLYKIPVLTVYGQHDLYFRSIRAKNKVALKVMESADVVEILDDVSLNFYDDYCNEVVAFYGSSYGEDVPEIGKDKYKHEADINVLVVHKKISNVKVPFEYVLATDFLNEYTFDYIISGDNHKSFVVRNDDDNKWLINPGALVRQKIDEVDHQPEVFVFDTKKKDRLATYFIPCADVTEVFDMRASAPSSKIKDVTIDDIVKKFALELKMSKQQIVDFKYILSNYLIEKEEEIRLGVRDIFAEIISSLEEKNV